MFGGGACHPVDLIPHRCSSRSGRGTGQQLIVATDLLLPVVLAVAPLGSSASVGLAIFSYLWGRWRVPGSTVQGPGALFC
jgi:hypothetical protein